MKQCFFIILFIFISLQIFAQSEKKEYTATRALQQPKIDSFVTDEVWKSANSTTDFVQREPVFNSVPTQNSEVKVVYDDNAIYVGAIFYDSQPDSIFAELGSRDDGNNNADRFYIGFDTYNKLDAYVFGVSSSGVQFDYRDTDPTYDAVWESSTKITDKGWSLEMRIPYSAIRFPSVPEQEWGFQIIRMIIRNNEYIQWALTPKTVANSRTLWGKIKGIQNIKPPIRLSMTPFINLFYKNEPSLNSNQTEKYNNSFSYNFGADLKYGIDEKFTIDITLMPDFSQVQSDNKIKTLSYNEVTFNENRPFFKEGTELFNQNQLFYSRRIGRTPEGYYQVSGMLRDGEVIKENPSTVKLLNAIKLSGRNNNGLGIGLFNAITDNTYAVVEDSLGHQRKIKTEPLSNYNVIVFDKRFQHNSSIYFINTNVLRYNQKSDANVTGAGFTLMDKKNVWATDANTAFSQKYTGNDSIENLYSTLTGYRYFLGFRKVSGNFQFGISHTLINKTYDSRDMGYYVIGNRQKERIYFTYNTYEPTKLFRETYNFISFDYWINPETGKTIYSNINFDLTGILHNYYSINFGGATSPFKFYDYNEPRVPERYSRVYRNYYFYTNINSDSKKDFIYSISGTYGDFTEKFSGVAYSVSPSVRYRVNDKIQMGYSFNYNFDNYNIGFVDIGNENDIIYGGRELTTYENSLSFQYVIINDMSILLGCRHYWNTGKYEDFYTLLDNGEIEKNDYYDINPNFSYNVFNIDLVYSWQFAPGSTLSVTYKNAIETEETLAETKFSKNLTNTFDKPQTNSLSIKVLYYLDYLYARKVFKKKNS